MFEEIICIKCYYRWVAVCATDTVLKNLQCPHCKEKGYAILTGQQYARKWSEYQ